MKQILVNKSIALNAKVGGGTISGINEINLLDTGAIAVFTEGNVMITVANAGTVLSDVKNFYIAVGNQNAASKTIISTLIPRIGTTAKKQVYVAPVKLTKFIGNDGTIGALNNPTLVAGQEAFIRIVDTTPGLRTIGAVDKQEVFRYTENVIAGDTINTVITRIIARINADVNRIVNATVVGAQVGINVTAIDYGTTFSIALDGILVGATIEQPEGTVGSSVAINFGKGTSDQISALEDAYSVERGNTNRINLPAQYFNLNSLVVSGSTYDTYTFAHSGNRKTSTGTQNTFNFETIVAMPASATQQANFETLLTEIFVGTTLATPAETGV